MDDLSGAKLLDLRRLASTERPVTMRRSVVNATESAAVGGGDMPLPAVL
ncbi:hypothetical protein ACIBI3_08540 [Actinomadura luteofluorescens]